MSNWCCWLTSQRDKVNSTNNYIFRLYALLGLNRYQWSYEITWYNIGSPNITKVILIYHYNEWWDIIMGNIIIFIIITIDNSWSQVITIVNSWSQVISIDNLWSQRMWYIHPILFHIWIDYIEVIYLYFISLRKTGKTEISICRFNLKQIKNKNLPCDI